LLPGEVMRVEDATAYAGGKALNVARNLRRLGESVRVVGFLGGTVRSFIEGWCAEAGVDATWVTTAGESRTCVTLVDREAGTQSVVNEPGPQVTGAEVKALLSMLQEHVQSGDYLCVSGSAPPGVTDETYGEIVRAMRDRGVRVLVDATVGPLRAALQALPWAVAPNESELRMTMMESGEDMAEPARELGKDIPVVIVTLGREGCMLATDGLVWRVQAPHIKEVNAVGSGDAFVAGFLAGVQRGMCTVDAVKLGTACGASNAERLEPGIGPWGEVETLLQSVTSVPLTP
jgi:tagatose 6-phosphate kinase